MQTKKKSLVERLWTKLKLSIETKNTATNYPECTRYIKNTATNYPECTRNIKNTATNYPECTRNIKNTATNYPECTRNIKTKSHSGCDSPVRYDITTN